MDGPGVTALWLLNRSTARPGAIESTLKILKGRLLGIHSSSIISEQSWAAWEQVFWVGHPSRGSVFSQILLGDMAFTAFFTLDVAFRILVLQRKFWRVCMNYVDVLVTVASLIEVAFVALVLPMNPTLFRLLRIGASVRVSWPSG